MSDKRPSWAPPEQYARWVDDAEKWWKIPSGLLGRVLYQESHYRPEIISGEKRSGDGAVGIAQFMPATAKWLGIDPLDPEQAIEGAARYLSNLYSEFGDWRSALAAYNWGPGNVKRKGLGRAPKETRDYYTEILGDVQV